MGLTLKYTEDIKTISFIVTYFILLVVLWAELYSVENEWLLYIVLWVVMTFFSFFGAVITHNTMHNGLFKERWANNIFQCALSLTYGHPVSAYVPGHNLSHHRFVQSRKDMMRTSKLRYKTHIFNLLFFQPTVAKDVLKSDVRYLWNMRHHKTRMFWQSITELVVLMSIQVCILYIDWWKFITLWYIPHFFAQWAIVTLNLLQHDGCDEESKYNHSRNFTSPFLNWWTFNNGYHTIHHLYPGLHWSVLPRYHEEKVLPHIHPALDQSSMAAYVYATFVKGGGRRVRYDGKPVVFHDSVEEDQDMEWFSPKSGKVHES